MTETATIDWDRDADDIVVLTIDDPAQRVNTMTHSFVTDLATTLDRLEAEQETLRGVVLTSGKKTFFAGGDLNDLRDATRDDVEEFSRFVARNSQLLRRLETLGVPVVSAINGSALGGGLELTLATHRRIAVDTPSVRLGLPEVTLGLLPGAGGVVRTVRLLGVQRALEELLLRGQQHGAVQALELGIVDQLVVSPDDLMVSAKEWLLSGPEPTQPWDRDGHAIPGGRPQDRNAPLAAMLPALTGVLQKQLRGTNQPAPRNILAAAVEGAGVSFDEALLIEARYFVDLATGPVSSNMIQGGFFDLQEVKGDRGRSADRTPSRATKVAVLGAGMMGAGIAHDCAKAGLDVVLKDVDLAAAERGKAYAERLVTKQVEKGRLNQESAEALLSRITPTVDASDAAGADLVIEAVFEDEKLKAEVIAEIEPYLAPDALVGSNTSTLPITGLAEAAQDPARFIGLHFFSPVDRMPLLEIIRGELTSDESLSRALDLAQQIGKTPIVVNDSRGFFTSRVIKSFIHEALAMLGEGVPATTLEQASAQAGYPAPVLQLTDELNMELLQRIRRATQAAARADGEPVESHPADAVIDTMVDGHGRPGRLGGAGFHEYVDGDRSGLWSGLADAFGGKTELPFEDVKDRMLFAEVLESVACLDEGVLISVADGNVGSLLGIGFPSWTGGVLQFVDGYDGGVAGFVERARELAGRYGEHFTPPSSLVEIGETGGTLRAARGFVGVQA